MLNERLDGAKVLVDQLPQVIHRALRDTGGGPLPASAAAERDPFDQSLPGDDGTGSA